jgi:hypothetical protein
LYNLQKLYIAIKEKSAFLIFIDTDLIAVFICWEGIDWLWCQSIFLPNMSNLSEIVKGIELGDFLFEPAIMDKTLRQIAAGNGRLEQKIAQLNTFNNLTEIAHIWQKNRLAP